MSSKNETLKKVAAAVVLASVLSPPAYAISEKYNAPETNPALKDTNFAELPSSRENTKKIPTNGEMQKMFGFDKTGVKPVFSGKDIPWEPAKWQFQSVKPISLPLLKGWQFTVTRPDGVVAVYYGDGTTIEATGFSARYLSAYNTKDANSVLNPQKTLENENKYSMSMDPPYKTIAGNFKGTETTIAEIFKIKKEFTPETIITPELLSENIGGEKEHWTKPTWESETKSGAWVYKDKGNPVSLKFPTKSGGEIDVEIIPGKGSVHVDLFHSSLLKGVKADEFSFTPKKVGK